MVHPNMRAELQRLLKKPNRSARMGGFTINLSWRYNKFWISKKPRKPGGAGSFGQAFALQNHFFNKPFSSTLHFFFEGEQVKGKG